MSRTVSKQSKAEAHREMEEGEATVLESMHGHIGTADIDGEVLKVCEDPLRKEGQVESIFRTIQGVPQNFLVGAKREEELHCAGIWCV